MLSEVTISVVGGSGGSGVVSFRRERYVPRGGPDGGDGGRGGEVIVEVDAAVVVMDELRRRRVVRAEAGQNGGPAKRHGRAGGCVVVPVPVGTLVWKVNGEERLLADLSSEGMRVVVARGGRGGKGNARLARAARREPRVVEKGLAGERARIRLELRLLAEVGLVGAPNAGKSSLLRAASKARPRVGAYPFTTTEPYLGVVEVGYDVFVMADIPGIVEGAHRGVGLGIDFLQQVRRTRVLVYVVDGAQPDPGIDVVERELREFGHGLLEKRRLVALNKIDLPEAKEQERRVVQALSERDIEVHSISAVTGEGIERLMERLHRVLQEEREREASRPIEPPTLRPAPRRRFQIVRSEGRFEVRGKAPTEVIEMLGVESEEARAEVQRRLVRMGVAAALRRAGLQPGDRVRVGGAEIEWLG